MNILILTYISAYKMRGVQKSLVDSYGRYLKDANVVYVNLFFFNLQSSLLKYEWDLILFHSSLLSLRFNRDRFKKIIDDNKKRFLALKGYKACAVQDEFVHMDLVCGFINTFNVSLVFTVSPLSEVRLLYKEIDFQKVKFHRLLTGYIDYELVKQVAVLQKNKCEKDTFIGYRVVSTPQWGTFNLKKKEIADLFVRACEEEGLSHDIKIGENYFLTGNQWLIFLASCRATIGIEGGANILDWDGKFSFSIIEKIKNGYQLNEKTLSELESDIVKINLKAISPRHLEACITKTCQVLVEGDYNGVLKPWVHYIPLKPDYSNLQEVLAIIQDDAMVSKIVEKAYDDIVGSGRYGYNKMVEEVINTVLQYSGKSTAVNLKIIPFWRLIQWSCTFKLARIISYMYELFKGAKKSLKKG